MNTLQDIPPGVADFTAGSSIYCILPDDGTDKRVLAELREKKGITRAGSAHRRGIGALAEVKTKPGELPEPVLVKQLYVICSEDQSDEIFDFIFWSAKLDKPGRGIIWQQAISCCTPYELPPDIPDEVTGT